MNTKTLFLKLALMLPRSRIVWCPLLGLRLHIGAQDGVDAGLVAALLPEPAEKVGIKPHGHDGFRRRHNDLRLAFFQNAASVGRASGSARMPLRIAAGLMPSSLRQSVLPSRPRRDDPPLVIFSDGINKRPLLPQPSARSVFTQCKYRGGRGQPPTPLLVIPKPFVAAISGENGEEPAVLCVAPEDCALPGPAL